MLERLSHGVAQRPTSDTEAALLKQCVGFCEQLLAGVDEGVEDCEGGR